MWEQITRNRVLRFAAVGAANTGVHCAVYLGLWTLLPFVVAHVIATAVAMICSYVLNCRFTFGVVPAARSFALYPVCGLATLGLSTAAVGVLVAGFGVSPVVAPILGGLLVLPVTFTLSRAALTHRPHGDLLGAGLVGVLVALLAQVPVLVNPAFYFWDDSAAQFLPMWHRLGQRLLAGEWPLALDADLWMGGNLAAESLFGIWNPVNLLDFLLVVGISDLAVAATVIKTQFLVILGVGTYLLCREYGASRAAASVLGTAFPVSGFVLYFQAASWAGGLLGLAWIPWVWWSLRRMGRGKFPVFVPWIFCFLCASAGDPYGVLAMCFVFAGLLIESVIGKTVALHRILGTGVAVALVVPLIFLPLVLTGSVSWRSGLELFNVGRLVPGIGDLINISMPSFVPQILSFGSFRMTVPTTYLAWFVVPLLPWLNWRSAVREWRRCAAPVAVAACYFLLCLGPSNAWLFRWPLRHIAVLHLAVAVLFAVVLSFGVRTSHFRQRTFWTAGALLGCAYLSFAAWPSQSVKHLVSLGAIFLLVSLVLVSRSSQVRAAVLQFGTVLMLVLQIWWFPANRDVATYNFPTDVGELRSQFSGDRGTVAQIAQFERIPGADIESRRPWRHLLFGNMPAVAGVRSLSAYTGIGYRALHERLCLSYNGSTCASAYPRLWVADETGFVLADQLKIDKIVVQRSLTEVSAPPAGWSLSERNADVTVLRRDSPSPWQKGRLSAARGVQPLDDLDKGQAETVRFRRDQGSGGEIFFARLAWPGYEATVDGREVPTAATSAGLLKVNVPPGRAAGVLRISWNPPGAWLGALLAGLGAGLAAFLSLPIRRRLPC
ncbi:GtrA family protein [Saccharopolyspora taberi]|uniref:GtrA/DPMS transmembrane domain-containing protein n=1 Tax=Saccharopolyspora taberi TaxID=60895 RepID=A0ABN3VEP3_9PSEU